MRILDWHVKFLAFDFFDETKEVRFNREFVETKLEKATGEHLIE